MLFICVKYSVYTIENQYNFYEVSKKKTNLSPQPLKKKNNEKNMKV